MKKLDYLCNSTSEISKVSKRNGMSFSSRHENRASRYQCLFDWLISEQQSVNSWREAILLLSGKRKRFTAVRPVSSSTPNYSNKLYYQVS